MQARNGQQMCEACIAQRRHPVEARLGKADILARGGNIDPGQVARIGERDDIGLRACQIGLRARQRDAIGFGVDAEQQLPRRDLFALPDEYLDNLPANFAADGDHILLDIGIVGRNLALQAQPIEARGGEEQEWHRQHQRQAAAATRLWLLAGSAGCSLDRRIDISHRPAPCRAPSPDCRQCGH